MAKFAPRMGDPHGDPQTSPQHADPHGLGAFLKKTIQEVHVDQRVVGWSVGRHVDRPRGGKFHHSLPEKALKLIGIQERICICHERFSAEVPTDLSLQSVIGNYFPPDQSPCL